MTGFVCFRQEQEERKDIITKPQLVLQLQSDVHLLLDADVVHKRLQRDRDKKKEKKEIMTSGFLSPDWFTARMAAESMMGAFSALLLRLLPFLCPSPPHPRPQPAAPPYPLQLSRRITFH